MQRSLKVAASLITVVVSLGVLVQLGCRRSPAQIVQMAANLGGSWRPAFSVPSAVNQEDPAVRQ